MENVLFGYSIFCVTGITVMLFVNKENFHEPGCQTHLISLIYRYYPETTRQAVGLAVGLQALLKSPLVTDSLGKQNYGITSPLDIGLHFTVFLLLLQRETTFDSLCFSGYQNPSTDSSLKRIFP